ncbi:MAG: hypothetical protein P9L94_16235 [Candidatus Hinthialibacter antarcticus]|nr:hypothetical protein [Candidatus Hinthialibacter antarcticus]
MSHKILCSIVALFMVVGVAVGQELDDVVIVTDAIFGQQFPDVTYNSTDNTFLVVWEEQLVDRVHDIHGVIVNGDTGAPIMEPFLIMSDPAGMEAPEAAYNSTDNEFVVVARMTNSSQAYGQRVATDGQLLGNFTVIDNSGGPTFFDPAARARVVSVAYNATDNKYIAGLSQNPSAQILFPNLDLDIPVDVFGNGTNSSVAWSSVSNVYLVAWEDRESRNTGSENLSAQLLDANGELIGETLFIRDQEFAEESPRVAYNSDDDQFLVIWDERIGFSEGLDPQTATDVIGQIVSADGSLVGEPVPIEKTTAYSLRQDADYSSAAGVYLVVWKGDPSGEFAFADIYGRFIGRDGSLASDIFLIYDGGDDATEDFGSERYYDESKLPAVATNTQSGDFFVVWEEDGTEGDPDIRDIYARFVRGSSSITKNWQLY